MKLIDETQADDAVECLKQGGLVAFPTETVYGLGADACNGEAVKKIYAAKQRPIDHPLIAHIADVSMLESFAINLSSTAKKLAEAFWPGPLTLVVERSDKVAAETVGGRDTVGIRVPDHPLALTVLSKFGGAVAAPSANKFGFVSPTLAEHVLEDFVDIAGLVLDGGPCRVGVESTIIDATHPEPVLLRYGGISLVEIEAVAGVKILDDTGGPARASGMHKSHYSPKAKVELVNADWLRSAVFETVDEVSLFADSKADTSIGIVAPFAHSHPISWQLSQDASQYARDLYSTMREADQKGVTRLLIAPPESGDLLDAVLDRLTRAAS